jgi:AcrR family transcriptional regulator
MSHAGGVPGKVIGVSTDIRAERPSEARDRLLRTAGRIFYTKGINSVGVEELVSAAGVTRATFYRHYPSKDDLIVAYLTDFDRQDRAHVEALISTAASPVEALRAVAASIARQISDPDFRGCAFLNAAAEYPDPRSRVHQAVLEHRAWFLRTMTALFAQVPGLPGEGTARHFVMLRDGAMASGCLADPEDVGHVFTNGVEGYLRYQQAISS